MCQVTPFTFPCCKRIYVLVEKLPNCPADWPRSKCPQELCIQVIDVETAQVKRSTTGTCWRCKAAADGKSGDERETMRPEIDRAIIVEGLEELDVTDRRRRAEAGGNCWYCGARHGCSKCGVNKRAPTPTDPISPRRQDKKPRSRTQGNPRKKTKADGSRGMFRKPSFLKPPSLPTGFSQPAFPQPTQGPSAAEYLPTPNPAQGDFPTFQNDGRTSLPTISGDAPESWPTGPYTDYAAFWENYNALQAQQIYNAFQAQQPAAMGKNQIKQDIKPSVGCDTQAPGADIFMDPGGTGHNNQISGSHPYLNNAGLFNMMNQFSNCYSSSGKVEPQEAPQAERKPQGDQESNIDPALTQEGRGKTP